MPLPIRLLSPINGSHLLDQFGGASAAYSLRRLRTGYTGAAVRVRRSNDNAESDFTSEEVANGVLSTWVGANTGFVTTWYDQSGNGRNATQSTASQQPKIVVNGVVESLNGQPATLWDGTGAGYSLASTVNITTASSISFIAVLAPSDIGLYHSIFHIGNDDAASRVGAVAFAQASTLDWQADDFLFFGAGFGFGNAPRIISSGAVWSSSSTTQRYMFSTLGPTRSVSYVGKVEIPYRVQLTGNVVALSGAAFTIGNRGGTGTTGFQYFSGRMQELVVWLSDEFSNRTGIDANVSNHYGL